MKRSRVRATVYGATAGALAGLAFMVLFVGRFSLGSVSEVDGRASFEVSTGSMYLLTVILGLLGGLVIAVVAYAYGRETEPEAKSFPLSYLAPTGAVTAALFAYATLRFGVGAVGDITAGVATISVVRMTVVALIMGVVSGSITGLVVDSLARPAFLGLEGEAMPESAGAMMKEMMRAVGAPIIAIVAAAAFAISLSQVLLAVEGVGAVAIFSVVGAIVLGGATLIALRPWDRDGQPQG